MCTGPSFTSWVLKDEKATESTSSGLYRTVRSVLSADDTELCSRPTQCKRRKAAVTPAVTAHPSLRFGEDPGCIWCKQGGHVPGRRLLQAESHRVTRIDSDESKSRCVTAERNRSKCATWKVGLDIEGGPGRRHACEGNRMTGSTLRHSENKRTWLKHVHRRSGEQS